MNTPTPAWNSDEYDTLLLHPKTGDAGLYVYMQARRPYCDRGHWEWGNMGINYDRQEAPSYYFMRQAVLRAEVEAWLGRLAGEQQAGPRLADLANGGEARFEQSNGQALGWAWSPGRAAHTLEAHATLPSGDAAVVLTLTEHEGTGGPVWTLTQEGVPNLDDADRFPRTYLNLNHAKQEAEDFLAWRLLKVASEYHDRFEDVHHPLPLELAKRLEDWNPQAVLEKAMARTRRPK